MTSKTELINFYSSSPKLENAFAPQEEAFIEALEKKSPMVRTVWLQDLSDGSPTQLKPRVERIRAMFTESAPTTPARVIITNGEPKVQVPTQAASATSATVVRRTSNNDDDDVDDKKPVNETVVVKLNREPPQARVPPPAIVGRWSNDNDDDEDEFHEVEDRVIATGNITLESISKQLAEMMKFQMNLANKVTGLEAGKTGTDLGNMVANALFTGKIVEKPTVSEKTVQVPVYFTIGENGFLTAEIVSSDIMTQIGPKVTGPVRCSLRSIKNERTGGGNRPSKGKPAGAGGKPKK